MNPKPVVKESLTAQITPRPWLAFDTTVRGPQGSGIVAVTYDKYEQINGHYGQSPGIEREESEKNAAHIVKCINNYESMIQLLRDIQIGGLSNDNKKRLKEILETDSTL